MTQNTSPDNIAKWTGSDPTSLIQQSQTQGDSVQAAFNKRERYSFVWANSTERTAQTGMVAGSEGYQLDTKVNYIYTGSLWTETTVRFFGSQTSATTNNTGANIAYTSVEDTAGGWSSGVYTVQISGNYMINLAAKQSTAVIFHLRLFKNSLAIAATGQTPATTLTGVDLNLYLPLIAGDTLQVQPSVNNFTTQADTGPAHNNYLQFIRLW